MLLGFFLAGCISRNPQRAIPTDLTYLKKIWCLDTTNHLAYIGSDKNYDYVIQSKLFDSNFYKIPINQLSLSKRYEFNQGEPYCLMKSDLRDN